MGLRRHDNSVGPRAVKDSGKKTGSPHKAQHLIIGAATSVVTDLPCHMRGPGPQNSVLCSWLLSQADPEQLSPSPNLDSIVENPPS